jgi:dihydroorotate dehydrogenase
MQTARQDLALSSPWLNSPGSLGFAPGAGWPWNEPIGAFLTNPISFKPRVPAEERRLLPYPGGFLLHSGWPNPGFSRVLQAYSKRWASAQMPVWVHLLAEQPGDLQRMVLDLEGVEGVMAVELGMPPQAGTEEALTLVGAASGELPLVVNLPLTAAGEAWVGLLPGMGVSAVHLSAPRGSLPLPGGRTASGRLYGPGLLPLALEAVRRLKPLGLPVVAGCGIFCKEDGLALLSAGAAAVALDAVLWQIRP